MPFTLISHGGDGQLFLGNATVDAGDVAEYAETLGAIGASLARDGDILIDGCNLGRSGEGEALIEHLSVLTGADVAAFDDRRAVTLGGDVELEITTGNIEAAGVFDDGSLADYNYALAT